jgi:hypothetical protein
MADLRRDAGSAVAAWSAIRHDPADHQSLCDKIDC